MAGEPGKKIFSKIQIQKLSCDMKMSKYITKASKNVKGINDALFNTGQTKYEDYIKRRHKKENQFVEEEKYETQSVDMFNKFSSNKRKNTKLPLRKNLINKLLELKEDDRRTFLLKFVRGDRDQIKSFNLELSSKRTSSKSVNIFKNHIKKGTQSRNNVIEGSKKENTLDYNKHINPTLIASIEPEIYQTTNDSISMLKPSDGIPARTLSGKRSDNQEIVGGLFSVKNRVASGYLRTKTNNTKKRKDSDFMKDVQFNPMFITDSQHFKTENFPTNIDSDVSDEIDYLQCLNNSRKESKLYMKKTMNEKYENSKMTSLEYLNGSKYGANEYLQTLTEKNKFFFPKNKKIFDMLKKCNEEYQKSEHLCKKIIQNSNNIKNETKRIKNKNNHLEIAKKRDKENLTISNQRKVLFSTNSRNQPKIIHLDKDNIFIKNKFASSLNELNAYSNRYHITERFNIKLKNSEIANLNMDKKKRNL